MNISRFPFSTLDSVILEHTHTQKNETKNDLQTFKKKKKPTHTKKKNAKISLNLQT